MRRGKICRDGTRSANNDRELERDHLTSLPALDMEHFMYRQDLMTFIIGWRRSDNVPMNMRR